MKNKQSVLQGAVLLSLAALIAKVLSAVYRVPLENFVGNTGFYVYQQVYPIYGIGMTFALNGLPVFISKIVAEQPTIAEQQAVARRLFKGLTILGVGLFALVYLTSGIMANGMGDGQLAPILRSVSWMFLCLPILSVGRGLAQGQMNMVPTALSQVSEQVVRVVIIIVVAYLAMRQHWNVYFMGMWAMASAPIAGIVASLFFVKTTHTYLQQPSTPAVQKVRLWPRLWTEGMLISAVAALLIMLQLIDSFTVKHGLTQFGMSSLAAKNAKGIYDRAQPLVQLGLVVATGFGTSLLPNLRQAFLQAKIAQMQAMIQTLLRLSLWLASAATVGLIALMPQINQLLFGSRDYSQVLSVYMVSVIAMSFVMMLASVLQSIDRYQVLVAGIVVALLSKALLNVWWLRSFGLMGASWATVVALVLMVIVIWLQLQPSLRQNLFGKKFIGQLTASLLIMAIFVILIAHGLEYLYGTGRGLTVITIIVGMLVGVASMLILTVKWHMLAENELLMLPKGERLVALLTRK
ncbi:polysaccharide biosynthesis protein [Periweissella cryptocerci]|uniref:Polysaccharide biosynthesis protein n=1 Tax=Periweissella cryptocerci TaxID=2506420 RepID=A0A4P6YT78_9LACO|nr:polysaccharide biosynthesis protein [Periweissella cryptocerci]QBO35872.1 polysaccharide biosynthesis protein [Periweissella cryptocerci]